MDIGTHFDYNNHIAFISTHTEVGTPHEKAPVLCNQSEFADLAFFSNVAATFAVCTWFVYDKKGVDEPGINSFCQCLSLIVSKLSTQDKN